MTYNFDPEAWYQRERAALDARFTDGDLDETAYRRSLGDLERRYEQMLDRLDGTFRLPEGEDDR